MTRPTRSAPRRVHPAVVAALALCAAWLIVQNAAVLAVLAWTGPGPALALGRAILRIGFVLLQQVWWLPLATLAVLALVASGLRGTVRREVRHG